MILSGQGFVKIGDRPVTAMKTFDITIIPPGARQSITNIGNSYLKFLALCTSGFKPECYRILKPAPAADVNKVHNKPFRVAQTAAFLTSGTILISVANMAAMIGWIFSGLIALEPA
ncbi:MAG TPA: hypothetical protein VFV48_05340 [Pseudomonadales bacterium]|nr:hypothetical protein [Pseudomonadales bacterium]